MDIDRIKNAITSYFRNNQLLSQRLPQAYILYHALKKNGKHPKLIMGYLVNHHLMVYYLHYWVELDGDVHDIIGESYNKVAYKLSSEVEVREKLSIHMLDNYINMDSSALENKRIKSFTACTNGLFFEDLHATASTETYKKIRAIYDGLVS